jgi:anti-sigma regulatory factor (Ser/Thr protein kinase)
MPDAQVREFQIRDQFDCAAAQMAVREMTAVLGFPTTVSEEIVLVVAELAVNLVRHAGNGVLILKSLQMGDRLGIEVDAVDHGPGMGSVDQSLTDGYSTAGSLGYGLGTVNRLMDEMEIDSTPGVGTQIVCRRWLRAQPGTSFSHVWDAGVVTRSRRCAPFNGDAFVIREWEGKLLAAVIDGLGHGEFAQQAALAAQRYVQTHYDQSLDKIFSGTGRACLGTRGVVMALVRFESRTQITFASFGNVEARVWSGPEKTQLVVQRGVLGLNDRNVTVQTQKWSPGWVLVLHTDGVSDRWQWHDFPGLEREPASVIAGRLLRGLANRDDDATVVVIRDQMR